MRRFYREALLAAERGDGPLPPSPLDPAEAKAFLDWVRYPSTVEALPPRSRAAILIQEGPYLGSRNALVRLAQRALLRMLRPLLLHEQIVARALLESVEEISDRKERISTRVSDSVALPPSSRASQGNVVEGHRRFP